MTTEMITAEVKPLCPKCGAGDPARTMSGRTLLCRVCRHIFTLKNGVRAAMAKAARDEGEEPKGVLR